jgi:hypothetical protein
MFVVEQNDRLTRVSLGTPMGDLLSRYGHSVATVGELHENPVKSGQTVGRDARTVQGCTTELGTRAVQ